MRWIVHFAFFLIAVAICSAQTPSAVPDVGPTTGGSVIAGVVTDGKVAVRRAVVTLSTIGPNGSEAVAWTDGEGRFSFSYLPAGRYYISAHKEGFEVTRYGAESMNQRPTPIAITAGQSRTDLNIRLLRFAAVSGTVVDDRGNPLANVTVQALVRRPGTQRRVFTPRGAAQTDSLGHYRIHNLIPGRYIVAAVMHQPVLRGDSEVSALHPQNEQYMAKSQYYPGVEHPSEAAMMAVAAAKELTGVNFRLDIVRAVNLEGTVTVPSGVEVPKNISVMFRDENAADRMTVGTNASAPEYRFMMANLRPGTYLLTAQCVIDGKNYRGFQKVDVQSDSTPTANVALQPPIELSGSVKLESGAAMPSTVMLYPGDDMPATGTQPTANVNKDGTFKFTGVTPGVWDIGVRPLPNGGYIKSMRLGDEDVFSADMAVTPQTNVPLNIVLSGKAASLEGSVAGAEGKHVTVLAAPEGQLTKAMSVWRTVAVDDKGHFEIPRVRPGTYRLYAFEEFDDAMIGDPIALEPFKEKSMESSFTEGQSLKQDLSLIKKEDQQ